MWETVAKIISVYFFSMLKFIFGPFGGYKAGLNLITTILTTVAGMMTVVILFTYGGEWIKHHLPERFKGNRFSIKNQNFAKLWKKYGLVGVALLTPLILTPIGGTILAVSSGSAKDKIIFYMFISASVWSIIICGAIYIFGAQVLPEILRP